MAARRPRRPVEYREPAALSADAAAGRAVDTAAGSCAVARGPARADAAQAAARARRRGWARVSARDQLPRLARQAILAVATPRLARRRAPVRPWASRRKVEAGGCHSYAAVPARVARLECLAGGGDGSFLSVLSLSGLSVRAKRLRHARAPRRNSHISFVL